MKIGCSVARLTGCFAAVAATLLIQGCELPSRLKAVPQDVQAQAVIPGMSNIRYRAPVDPAEFMHDGMDSIRREQAMLEAAGYRGPLPVAEFLAISGGGDNGAFGAGLLVGWTAAGNRPQFKAVTGVSTGALIAPFAFLGSDYDPQLKEVYTTISPEDVLEPRSLLAAIFSDAMADNAPLWKLVGRFVTQDMLDAIAAEHAKGRWLLIGTADLDARRGVIWNVGKIAASGHPKALDLVHQILIASAAIPGAFPPVMIDVEVGGKPFNEMHVDGGTIAQVFAYPGSIQLGKSCAEFNVCRDRRLYVIRNARLDPDWADVERQTLTIAGRAISSLINSQGIGDLYRIFLSAQRDGVDFNLAFIPESFKAVHKEDFDREYMRQLFDLGYDLAAKGYPWAKFPPGYSQ